MAGQLLDNLIARILDDASDAATAITAAANHAERARAKRIYRRKSILPGFPIRGPCPSLADARAYLAEPKLVCLLCGKAYAILANHLRSTHGVTPDEYRAAYHLPWSAGLAGAQVAAVKSKNLKERLSDPRFMAVWSADAEKHRRKAHERAHEQRADFFRKQTNLERLTRAGTGPYGDDDFLRILDVMKERDLILKNVAGKIPGLPSYDVAVKWFNSTPARKQLLVDTVHQLSIPNQALSRLFSPRTIGRVHELAGHGLLQRKIAAETGLCVMTVAKLLRMSAPKPEVWSPVTYQLTIMAARSVQVSVGRFGEFKFPAGTYVYTGSAKRNIEARIARHLRKQKTLRWHIDWLLAAPGVKITSVRRSVEDECVLNQKTGGEIVVPGFGASDCVKGCGSHLRYLVP